MEQKKVTINNEQGLYVIPSGNNGFSCLGFDVVINKIKALCTEMNLPYNGVVRGSIEAYNTYLNILEEAYKKYEATGWKSKTELYEPFIGHEGKRVEVEYLDGEKERFYIGKSTGWIPCHIMVKQSNSVSGCAVLRNFIKRFRFIEQ